MRPKAFCALLACACGSGWEIPIEERPSLRVEVAPEGTLEAAPEVLRLSVRGALGRSALEDFRLFAGELTSSQLGRIEDRDLPKTLLEREVPLFVWAEPPEVRVAPMQPLAAGRYSLATPELGLVASVVVVAEARSRRLDRLWPPAAESTGAGLMIFCGDRPSLGGALEVNLEPLGTPATLAPGLDETSIFSEACVRIEARDAPAGVPLLPPALARALVFEPRPLWVRAPAADPPECGSEEVALGPACASIDDDRLVLRAGARASLWAFEAPELRLGVVTPESKLVVRGLVPGESNPIRAVALDASGVRERIERSVTALPRRPHLVIDEVLANPAGPEASSEWIEIVNDGAAALELAGFELRDTGGTFALPSGELAPGERALLVGGDFAPDPELDVPGAPSTAVFRLDSLGQSGLSNAGELLRLAAPDGRVVSRFPALPSSEPGRSLARIEPGAPDDEDGSFGPHAAPGASPGGENSLELSSR